MSPEKALEIIKNLTELTKITRPEHQVVDQAFQVLEEAIKQEKTDKK